ncbi:MAG TPA: metallophosphoesterase [Nitrososphaeraceae archaeon]|nr:metallophosphoesterase [Nitrososphaeraceae archaeon]
MDDDDSGGDKFFGFFPEDYYDLRNYREGIPLPEQCDQETTTTTIDSDHNNTLLLPTFDKYRKSAETTTKTTNYLSKNYSDDINFIAAGDWSCNKETKKTLKKITKLEPELVLGLGDYTFQEISPQCWFDISKPIDDIIKITIGNHDLDYQSSYYQILDHYNLPEPYYSFDFYNIHFVTISSEHPFENGSKQYEFIKNDLEESLQDPSILWRIVFLHKPMYTSADFDRKDSENLKNTFHQLFEKYQIDLVLSGHTQYYQRSLPISYNNYNATIPVVMDQNNYEYNNQDGIIFVTAGTAGEKLHKIAYFLPYYTIQKDKFGFLNFDLKNKGHTLIGTFYDTDDLDILDRFVISKDNHSGNKTFSEKEV